jgi:DNA-binding beta-propeller fold protein YncE
MLTFFATAGATSIAQSDKVYWTVFTPSKIQRANLVDGSDVEDLLVWNDVVSPYGIELDLAGGKMYWVSPGSDQIKRANLDGTMLETLADPLLLDFPAGIALDLHGGRMYWTDAGFGKIGRGNLDGTDLEYDWITGLDEPMALALDLDAEHLYWAEAGIQKIRRSDLDGSNIVDLIDIGQYASGIALDLEDGKIYWTEASSRNIRRANLDGSGIETLIHQPSGFWPKGIALDLGRGKMYWANQSDGEVARANLDGSDIEILVAGLESPVGIALALYADDEPVPAMSGALPILGTALLLMFCLAAWLRAGRGRSRGSA